MKYFIFSFHLLFILSSLSRKNNTVHSLNIENNLKLILKIENNEHCKTETKEDNSSPKEIILVHGSSSGMHTYDQNPGPSLKGLFRNLREKFWQLVLSSNKYDEFYDEKNKEKQSEYKQRKELFLKNKLPLISGRYFGLYKIDQDSEKNENHITQLANEFILKPFFKNFLLFQESNPIIHMFNWGGDLNTLDRKSAARRLGRDFLENATNSKKMIVGFSHGGNVTLEAVAQEIITKNAGSEIINSIEYLVLLGTPIGKKTKEWIEIIEKNSSIQIFNLYSTGDKVQIADFSFCFPYCERKINSPRVINIGISYHSKEKIIHPTHEQLYLYTKQKFPHFPVVIYLPFILNYITNYLAMETIQRKPL